MKKLFLALLVLSLIPSISFATMVDTRVSANTCTFNSVRFEVNRGPQIITFNTVTNHIRLINLSSTIDAYADIRCIDSNGTRGYATDKTTTILLPAIGRATPNSVEFNFATQNLAFSAVSNVSVQAFNEYVNNLKVHYVVTGDHGDF